MTLPRQTGLSGLIIKLYRDKLICKKGKIMALSVPRCWLFPSLLTGVRTELEDCSDMSQDIISRHCRFGGFNHMDGPPCTDFNSLVTSQSGLPRE